MRRRRLLAALGIGLSGCLGDPESPGSEPEPTEASGTLTPTPSETPPTSRNADSPDDPCRGTADSGAVQLAVGESYTTARGSEITLSNPRLDKIVTTSYLHTELWNHEGWQFVGLDVTVEGERPCGFSFGWPESTEFRPYVDGEHVPDPPDDQHDAGRTDELYVPFPVSAASSAAVGWERDRGPTVRWSLDDGMVAGLATAPKFEVRTYEIDYRQDGDDYVIGDFALTVANIGDRDGYFQGLFDIPDASVYGTVGFEVPAGETVTGTEPPSNVYEQVGECVAYTLDYGRSVEPTVTCPTPSG